MLVRGKKVLRHVTLFAVIAALAYPTVSNPGRVPTLRADGAMEAQQEDNVVGMQGGIGTIIVKGGCNVCVGTALGLGAGSVVGLIVSFKWLWPVYAACAGLCYIGYA